MDAIPQISHRRHLLAAPEPGITIILAILALFLFQPALSADEHSPVVRVGLISGMGKPRSLTVSCNRPFEIIDLADENTIAIEDHEVGFSAEENGIEVTVAGIATGTFKGPLRLTSNNDDAVFEIISPRLKYPRYRHVLEISWNRTLTVVNELSLEDYVKGVVPVEVPQSFHPEAQKALTVAMRTYAVKHMESNRHNGYDVCDCTHCQGFAGASKEAEWIDKLIEATRGQIAVHDGKPIAAVYSTDCGGATQNNEDAGFGKEPWPYLRSVADNQSSVVSRQSSTPPLAPPRNGEGEARSPSRLYGGIPPTAGKSEDYCARSPFHTWTKTFTADEFDRVFSRLRSAKIGKFQSMEFTDYDCSGRVGTVTIKGDQGEYRMKGHQFRELLGEDMIKSTRMALTVTPEGDYLIEGKGYGHGVGLCAFGADGLARSRKGITYVDILKHYYTGIEIKNISDCGLNRQDAKNAK